MARKAAAGSVRVYRGHDKHKARPTRGEKGTFCPEWTHATPSHDKLRTDMFAFDWSASVAQDLLNASVVGPPDPATEPPDDPDPFAARYATANGVAFKAVSSNDGTWHGYPIPWESVPNEFRVAWLKEHKVTQKQMRDFSTARLERRYDRRTWNEWPLETDDD